MVKDLQELHDAVLAQARKHKYTIEIGRSHGMHAEPLTFGFKMAVWLEEIRRHQKRLQDAIEIISVGKISGAVGTYANISPDVERITCQLLDLNRHRYPHKSFSAIAMPNIFGRWQQ